MLPSRREWLGELLNAIEQDRVAVADIGAATRQSLSLYNDPEIRDRIARLLSAATSGDRRQVFDEHLPALELSGSVDRGRAVFQKHCAACHQVDGVGHEVGPNLRALTNREPATLLRSILDPNAAVDANYVSYVVLFKDGRTLTGIIATETGGSFTLVGQENKRQDVLRDEIDQIHSTGKSLMPEGIERDVSQQDLADLIAYLRQSK